MLERQLQTKFKNDILKEFKKNNIQVFYYKIADSVTSGLKPFDSFLLVNAKFFAFEFKVKNREPKKHQEYFLNLVKQSGGASYVVKEDNYKNIIKMIIKGAIITRDLLNNIRKERG